MAYWFLSANNLDPVSQPTSICGRTVTIAHCLPLSCVHDGDFDECNDAGLVAPSNVTEREFPCGPVNIKVQEAISCRCSLAPPRSLTVAVINGVSGAPVENATVSIVGSTAITGMTDSNGKSVLAIPSSLASPVVEVSQVGGKFLPSSKPVGPPTDFIIIYLFEVATPVQIDPVIENVLSLSDDPFDPAAGAVTLHIPANAFFTTTGGAPALGRVDFSVNFVQPDEDIGSKAPGVFLSKDESGNVVPIETMGVFALSARDADGNALSASGIGVSVGYGFRLFVLRNDGTWHLEPKPPARRIRRQTALNTIVGEITFNTDDVRDFRWWNIDKFPENTPCWFKTYILDTNSGNTIDGHTRHNFIALTDRDGSTSVLQLSYYSNTSHSRCFEARCDNENDNVQYPSIPIGIITADVLGIIPARATPMQLSDYQQSVQSRLSNLSYTPETTDRVRLLLESSADGPFFSNKSACEAASFTDGGNVLGFTVNIPSLNGDPFESSADRCVARARVYLKMVGFNEDNGPFNATSVWADRKYYYSDQQLYVFDQQKQTVTFCFIYRCSKTDDLTDVTIFVEEDIYDSFDDTDPFVSNFMYDCDIRFQAKVINSTEGAYYFNSLGDASAALGECAAETDEQMVVVERRCQGGREDYRMF